MRHKYFHQGNHKGENHANFYRIVLSLRQYYKMGKPNNKNSYVPPFLHFWSDLANTKLGPNSYHRKYEFSYRDFEITLQYIILGTISSNYSGGCTSRSIHNNGILKVGKHIFDGGTTSYNDNIHRNVFWSYNYNNTPS